MNKKILTVAFILCFLSALTIFPFKRFFSYILRISGHSIEVADGAILQGKIVPGSVADERCAREDVLAFTAKSGYTYVLLYQEKPPSSSTIENSNLLGKKVEIKVVKGFHELSAQCMALNCFCLAHQLTISSLTVK
jgi:hypothetical protein